MGINEVVKSISCKESAMSRIRIRVLRREMRYLYGDASARLQDPVNVSEYRQILKMFQHIFTKHFPARIGSEGQRNVRDVMIHINARQLCLIQVDPSDANILATSQIHFQTLLWSCQMFELFTI